MTCQYRRYNARKGAKEEMKSLDLFSGLGPANDTGITPLSFCDNNPAVRDHLQRHFPVTPIFEDVKHVSIATLAERGIDAAQIDIISGGFPCQDVSIAGNRAGLDGERSGLWFEYHRVVNEIRPRWIFVENVPGLLSSNGGRDFAIILAGLTGVLPRVPHGGWQNSGFGRGRPELYGVAWRVLDAQYFGVAQRRPRLFVVGSLGDGRSAEVLFEPACPGRHSTPATNDLYPVVYEGLYRKRYSNQWVRNGYAILDPETVRLRNPTPTECERLQGFPDAWTSGQPDSARYSQLGNAIAWPVREWIERRIVACNE